jgi:hypothetical protein
MTSLILSNNLLLFLFYHDLWKIYSAIYLATTTTSSSLPAQCSSYLTISDATRLYTYTGATSGCDSPTPFGSSPAWVRFSGSSGTMMASSSVTSSNCGTSATGWYSGSYPSVGGTTTGTACFNWSGNSCWSSTSISVTNCNTFYVYQLPASPCCSCRYCTA